MISNVRHAFTGHEDLGEVGLIHMNGRIYDPAAGRFLSADPIIQFPKYMQSFNRYSYLNNHPLSGTDPSGFERGAPGGNLDIPRVEVRGVRDYTYSNQRPDRPDRPDVTVIRDTRLSQGVQATSVSGIGFAAHSANMFVKNIPNALFGNQFAQGFYGSRSILDTNEPTTAEYFGMFAGVFSIDIDAFWNDMFNGEYLLGFAGIAIDFAPPLKGGKVVDSLGSTVHKNALDATGNYGLYNFHITIDGQDQLYKIGKADFDRVTKSSGLPTRVHQQNERFINTYGKDNVRVEVLRDSLQTTTRDARAAENAALQRYFDETGLIPKGNERSFRPKN